MSNKLEGKAALVTGGSRGIGANIAKRLAAECADVAITYTQDVEAAKLIALDLEDAGVKSLAIQADARDRYGTVDEVATLVSFIASPEASYITGASLTRHWESNSASTRCLWREANCPLWAVLFRSTVNGRDNPQ